MKNSSRRLVTLALVLIGAMASGTALAERQGHGYVRGHAQSGHVGNVRFGVSIGVPVYAARHSPVRHHTCFYLTYSLITLQLQNREINLYLDN